MGSVGERPSVRLSSEEDLRVMHWKRSRRQHRKSSQTPLQLTQIHRTCLL
jgi:hypothetical protein